MYCQFGIHDVLNFMNYILTATITAVQTLSFDRVIRSLPSSLSSHIPPRPSSFIIIMSVAPTVYTPKVILLTGGAGFIGTYNRLFIRCIVVASIGDSRSSSIDATALARNDRLDGVVVDG